MDDRKDGGDERAEKEKTDTGPMWGQPFTVEEAASILGCKRSTVYDLLAEGYLSRPSGATKRETGGRVTKKSLYQFVIVNRLNGLPVKVLRELKHGRKLFEKSASKNAEANCLSIVEGTYKAPGPTDPSPYPLTQGEGEHNGERQKRCLHHEFAEQHQFSFGWRAQQLAPDDAALQDDLMQEMSLAVLEYDTPASSEFLLELATNRAKNYIKYEAARGMLSLHQARHATDGYAEKMKSLNAFIESLMDRGVPVAWIEEVIGERMAG